MISPEELKETIREIRLRMNQSQEDFGIRFGVTRQAVARWEDGSAIPPANVLRELSIEKVYYFRKLKALKRA